MTERTLLVEDRLQVLSNFYVGLVSSTYKGRSDLGDNNSTYRERSGTIGPVFPIVSVYLFLIVG